MALGGRNHYVTKASHSHGDSNYYEYYVIFGNEDNDIVGTRPACGTSIPTKSILN